MKPMHGFNTLRTIEIPEIGSMCRHYKHTASGAELISVSNDDENKVFGITFGTPPRDSTGVAHILEHSVLCGSQKYPLKEPFVELLKGSLSTFLNAFTYPDKTCFPVASQNVRDLYNLADVYMDAVFHPLIDEWTFRQEAWHYSLHERKDPLRRTGVVYNEMQGAYSSPERLLYEYSQQAIFPDSIYGNDSGGDPSVIPALDYASFCAFKERYYHPSNARIWFWGDDNPEDRLIWLNERLCAWKAKNCEAVVQPQPRFPSSRRSEMTYAATGEGSSGSKAMFTVNWLLPEKHNAEQVLALLILEEILVGQSASPLKRALIESGLGESLIGGGLEIEIRQMYFSVGLKGIEPANIPQAEALIYETLDRLVREGIPAEIISAARNTVEFTLRERNSGRYPQGLITMLTSLSTWLYGRDPFMLLLYARPLSDIATRLQNGERVFEDLISKHFINNSHRATFSLLPDKKLAERNERTEKEELAGIKAGFTPCTLDRIISETKELEMRQCRQDSEEVLQSLPSLELEDLAKQCKRVTSREEKGVCPLFVNEIETFGIAYLDIAFDMEGLPEDLLPWARTWAQALVEMGTEKEDYASFATRIAGSTGGIRPTDIIQPKIQGGTSAHLVLRSRVLASRFDELISILQDVLFSPRFGDAERLKRIILTRKAGIEESLINAGHAYAEACARAMLHPASALAERVRGLSELGALRAADETSCVHVLRRIHDFLVCQKRVRFSLTASPALAGGLIPALENLGVAISAEPGSGADLPVVWNLNSASGIAPVCYIAPVKVHYVARAFDMGAAGYRPHGASRMAARALSMAWLWDAVRVQGGAYGVACRYSPYSGILAMASYRDPHLEKTLSNYAAAAAWLRDFAFEGLFRKQAIIGAVGELDAWQMPDARGFIAFINSLVGLTDEMRQKERDEIFAATQQNFADFAEALEGMGASRAIAIIGPETTLRDWAKKKGAAVSSIL
jgi:hypothetical protein